jgi:BTB/POZ domain
VSPPASLKLQILNQRSALGSEVVTLVVGAEKKIYVIHKKLLCDRSVYFSKAFQGRFKEASEGRMELPNDTVAAFDCLITWLYWGNMPPQPNFKGAAGQKCHAFSRTVLYPAYILAEKLCLPEMSNRVMDTIQEVQYVNTISSFLSIKADWHPFRDRYQILPESEDIQFVYDNTSETSKLRLYCVTSVAYTLSRRINLGGIKDFAALCSTIPDFAVDLLRVHHFEGNYIYDTNNPSDPRLRARTNDQSRTTKFTICHFHVHEQQLSICSPDGEFDWDFASDQATYGATANSSMI